jgi:hypothetical protein
MDSDTFVQRNTSICIYTKEDLWFGPMHTHPKLYQKAIRENLLNPGLRKLCETHLYVP